MKIILSFLALLLAGGGLWLIYDDHADEEALTLAREQQEYNKLVNNFASRLADADSLEKLRFLEADLDALLKKDQQQYQPLLDLALAEYYFKEGEENIFRAKLMLEATSSDEKEGKTNPIADNYIKNAFNYYRKAKEKIDSLEEVKNNNDFNFHFYYAKGNIYFRVLLLMANRNEVLEIFTQTAQAWAKALKFKEKDVDTELNIEILHLKKKEALKNAAVSHRQRVRKMPNQTKGRGGKHGVL